MVKINKKLVKVCIMLMNAIIFATCFVCVSFSLRFATNKRKNNGKNKVEH